RPVGIRAAGGEGVLAVRDVLGGGAGVVGDGLPLVDPEVELALGAVVPGDADEVGGAAGVVEADDRIGAEGGAAVVVAGDRVGADLIGAAGVHGEDRVEAGADGVDDHVAGAAWGPAEPH